MVEFFKTVLVSIVPILLFSPTPCLSQDCRIQFNCLNGGSCNPGTGDCDCFPGLFGPRCESIFCGLGDPCQNGGTCSDDMCSCQFGYEQPICFTGCATRQPNCQNGGTCNFDGSCSCPSGFSGSNCLTVACELNPCKNGGTCHDSPTGFTCQCPAFTQPPLCDSVDCSDDNPCGDGSCQQSANGEVCTCPQRTFQPFCSTHCLVEPCMNDGTCTSRGICLCPAGYQGPTCAEDIDECADGRDQCPAGDSRCVDTTGGYYCECKPGFTGDPFSRSSPSTCQVDCTKYPCFNDGTCTNTGCNCQPGFVGPQCTIGCSTQLCQGGGFCSGNVCKCLPGRIGPYCFAGVAAYLSPLRRTIPELDFPGINTFRVCRLPYDEDTQLTVRTKNMDATGALDFEPIDSRTVTVNMGKACSTVTVEIIPDTTPETDEEFYLILSLPASSGTTVFGQETATITIMDNDLDPDECQLGTDLCDKSTSQCVDTIGSYQCDCFNGPTYTPADGQDQRCSLCQTNQLFTSAKCSLTECFCGESNCDAPGDCSIMCSAFGCEASIKSRSLSPVNPGSDAQITCQLEGAAEVTIGNNLILDLSRSLTSVEKQNISQTLTISQKHLMYTVPDVKADDEFFCIISRPDGVIGGVRVENVVYQLPVLTSAPTLLSKTTTSIAIQWMPWTEGTDVGDPPIVGYIPHYKEATAEEWIDGTMVLKEQMLEFTVTGLTEDTRYDFSVTTVRAGVNGEGSMSAMVSIKTFCPDTSIVPEITDVSTGSSGEVTVEWDLPLEDTQCSTGVTFSVYYQEEGGIQMLAGMTRDTSFVIPSNILEPQKSYSISVRFTTDQDSQFSEPMTVLIEMPSGVPGAVIGGAIAAVVVLILILAVLVLIVVRRRRRRENKDTDTQSAHLSLNDLSSPPNPPAHVNDGGYAVGADSKTENVYDNPAATDDASPGPVRVSDFAEFVLANYNRLKRDFSLLGGSTKLYPWDASEKAANKRKNRFKNMYTYDHSRVVLRQIPGVDGSDYYNASIILNQNREEAFIASQAPNKASVDDFWRMIWERNVLTMAMVSNLYEDGKDRCYQYWPDNQGEEIIFDRIHVKLVKSVVFTNFVVRTLSVEMGDQTREIRQLHFTSWPDKDTPEFATPLLEFASLTKIIHQGRETLLVHCSAGIGRTGTFITMLCMMDVLQNEQYIDVFAFVNQMRDNRVNMLQTAKQYQFLHQCLYEFQLTNHCEITARFLSRMNLKANEGNLGAEFRLLTDIDIPDAGKSEEKITEGKKAENAPRNRVGNMLPSDRNRVFLISPSPDNAENYINASFVQSCEKKDAFITTQTPLPNTVEDFWRMTFDHKCGIVVMLNQLDLDDKTCVQYWPDRGSSQYGTMTITCIATEECPGYIKRTFDVDYENSKAHVVTHFQLEDWPPEASAETVVNLIKAVELHQKEQGFTKPIVVHCINGFERSGVFVTVKSEMERIRDTGLVNVFNTVKKLRDTHPNMLKKPSDYTLCYQLLKTHVTRNGDYENLE